jgi:hypothetical protein
MRAWLDTAGVRVRLECAVPWVARLIAECCGEALQNGTPDLDSDPETLDVCVEPSREAFDTRHMTVLTRSAWAGDGEVVIRDVCTSGFDLRLSVADRPTAVFRWRPPRTTLGASIALRSRFHLLVRAALLQYPAMWLASTRGAAPLHAPVCTVGSATALLAGAAGAGKSTLLLREVAAGGTATSDNLCVSDGAQCWGLVEPVRVEAAPSGDTATLGRRMPHRRREMPMPGRVPCLVPDLVVVLRRESGAVPAVQAASWQSAARALSAGTYMAGELRRYWPFAATLAAGTGRGPVHPPVSEVAARLTRRVPCIEVTVPSGSTMRLRDLLGSTAPSACA